MPVRRDHRLWVRKLDGDMHVVAEQPTLRVYPANLGDVVECSDLARNPPLGGMREARAIGSHWGISHVGVTSGLMIETATPVHEPDGDQTAPRLNHALRDVVPKCLSDEALAFFHRQTVPKFNPAVMPGHQEIYLFHVEAGMRIHELYALLDGIPHDDTFDQDSLASWMRDRRAVGDYSGPWALETMGGAGGQTIVGAMSTGTHGGDVGFGPLGEAVVALHLVDAKGDHHWIERTRLKPSAPPLKLVDEVKLGAHFHYHADDALVDTVTVACGRMGVIYSVVLRVVRQYALEESVTEQQWSDVKTWLTSSTAPIFNATPANRFAKVDVSPYGGFWHPSRHTCYIVTRVLRELDAAGKPTPLGRDERGKNPGTGKALGQSSGFFDSACDTDNWIRAAVDAFLTELKDLRETAIKSWIICAGAIFFPLTPPSVKLAALAAQQAAATAIVWTTGYIGAIDYLNTYVISPINIGFGDTISMVANFCAHNGYFAILRAIYGSVFAKKHTPSPENPRSPAISYAVMDEHDYLDVACIAPGDSIEIFFDATDPKLINFIDLVLIRVRQLENGELNGNPEAFGGSMRFMTASSSHIAMQRWSRTCSIEIAGLSHVDGTGPFLKQVEADAVTFGAALHWGQRNNWQMKDVEAIYGPVGPSGSLFKWRAALSDLTEHGRYDAFSTAFSKRTGLEITDPIIDSFSVVPTDGCAGDTALVTWDAIRNPPETQAFLVVTPQNGIASRTPLALSGDRQITLGAGRSTVRLVLERELKGVIYRDHRDIDVRGFSANEAWSFAFVAELHPVDGVTRWAVEINLFSQFISNALRVAEIHATFAGVPSWILRNPDIADLRFTTAQDRHALPSLPVFNKRWLFFSEAPAAGGSGPALQVEFKVVCQH
jgi:hypothetical protein